MRTTLDGEGRVAVPEEIRREAGITPGAPLKIRWADGRIEIEAEPLRIRLEQCGRFVLAVPVAAVAPLSEQTVENAIQAIRDERHRDAAP